MSHLSFATALDPDRPIWTLTVHTIPTIQHSTIAAGLEGPDRVEHLSQGRVEVRLSGIPSDPPMPACAAVSLLFRIFPHVGPPQEPSLRIDLPQRLCSHIPISLVYWKVQISSPCSTPRTWPCDSSLAPPSELSLPLCRRSRSPPRHPLRGPDGCNGLLQDLAMYSYKSGSTLGIPVLHS